MRALAHATTISSNIWVTYSVFNSFLKCPFPRSTSSREFSTSFLLFLVNPPHTHTKHFLLTDYTFDLTIIYLLIYLLSINFWHSDWKLNSSKVKSSVMFFHSDIPGAYHTQTFLEGMDLTSLTSLRLSGPYLGITDQVRSLLQALNRHWVCLLCNSLCSIKVIIFPGLAQGLLQNFISFALWIQKQNYWHVNSDLACFLLFSGWSQLRHFLGR